jgi:hypothetical protein
MTGHLLSDHYTINPHPRGAQTKLWMTKPSQTNNVRTSRMLACRHCQGAKCTGVFALARLMTARDRVRANGQSTAASRPSDESAQNHQETWNTRACDWSGNSSSVANRGWFITARPVSRGRRTARILG